MFGYFFLFFLKKGLILAVYVLCLLDACGVWFVGGFFCGFVGCGVFIIIIIISTFSFTSVFSLFPGNFVFPYQDLVLALFSNKGRENKPKYYLLHIDHRHLC